MISVIICSRGQEFRAATVESIAATIGVPYELIAVENGQGQYGICEAYNIGAAQANYPLLCFVHEDIAFRTSDWGKVVAHVLRDVSIGVVGVIGGKWLPKAPGTWWACGNKYLSSNVLNESPTGAYQEYAYANPENKTVETLPPWTVCGYAPAKRCGRNTRLTARLFQASTSTT